MASPLKLLKITQKFGKTPFAQAHKDDIYKYTNGLHTGVDFAAKRGENVYAWRGGVVVSSGWMSGWGEQIRIQHDANNLSLYAHLVKRLVSVGQQVKEGQIIGQADSTGSSTGDHLHFEIRRHPFTFGTWINPLPLLTQQEGEGVVEVDRHFVREHSLGILEREPTNEDWKRWEEVDEPTAHFVTEATSERKKLVKKEIEAVTSRTNTIDKDHGLFKQKTNARFESLVESVSQLTKQLEIERKVIADTSSKTNKIQETATDLVQEDIATEKRFVAFRDRMNTLEQGLRDLIRKGVSEGENQDSGKVTIKEIVAAINRWLNSRIK